MGDVIDLQARRAELAGIVAPVQPEDPTQRPGWLCRLDVFAPVEPGGSAKAGFRAFNRERIAAPADLSALADALEQIATSLRHGARADAV